MLKLGTPERIAQQAFGGTDILKLQSQHETFLKHIDNLPEKEKAVEIVNAVKFLIENKSYYWLETAHLLTELLGDSETDGKTVAPYEKIEPGITKKDFCPKYLGISYKSVHDYVKVIRDYKNYGFTDEQIRVLGFTKTRELLQKCDKLTLVNLSKEKDINKLKELFSLQIKPKKQKSALEILNHYWNKATAKEKQEFLRKVNAGENSGMD